MGREITFPNCTLGPPGFPVSVLRQTQQGDPQTNVGLPLKNTEKADKAKAVHIDPPLVTPTISSLSLFGPVRAWLDKVRSQFNQCSPPLSRPYSTL